ncbi:MAG: hypothetical protein ACPKM0_11500 [Pleomorphochaeta sp.]
MEIKHNRPEWILNFKKPTGTEIKYINGHWYLYERSSVWDSTKGKAKKKSGKLIGTITENGLILKKDRESINSINCFEFGASIFLYKYTHELRDRLETYYGEHWKIIYALILMKIKENCSLFDFTILYDVSFLKYKIGKLPNKTQEIKKAILFLSQKIEVLENFFNIEECNNLLKYYEHIMNKNFTYDTYFLDLLTFKNLEDDIIYLKENSKKPIIDEQLSYGLAIINFMAIHEINSLKNKIAEKGIYNTYRFETIINLLKTVNALKINRTIKITKLLKEVEKLCYSLDLDISIKN